LAVGGYRALDVDGIEAWLVDGLAHFAQSGPVWGVVPVGHGAAAAVLRRQALACPVPDYEEPIEEEILKAYRAKRDCFASTGSPALPDGLNLGAQLYRLEHQSPGLLGGNDCIVPWPQYWAWRLSGVAASELSSLGCHTDLWCPGERLPSPLARSRGWAQQLAPLRPANAVLGTLLPEWSARTGLPPDVRIYCGLHDSNAALLAAGGFPELAEREATVLSTGTWFVAMRRPGRDAAIDLSQLREDRDCLVNIDVAGRPVPSARFMGGREAQLLGGVEEEALQSDGMAALHSVVKEEVMVLPSLVPGVGPYPHRRSCWINEPSQNAKRQAAACLYLALMADASLDLIGARERLLIEGRFVGSTVFSRALATLRPDLTMYACEGYDSVPFGALRVVEPRLTPPVALRQVLPVEEDITTYRTRWRELAAELGEAA